MKYSIRLWNTQINEYTPFMDRLTRVYENNRHGPFINLSKKMFFELRRMNLYLSGGSYYPIIEAHVFLDEDLIHVVRL
jgi:hypothetical protein